MAEPLVFRIVSKGDREGLVYSVVKEVIDEIDIYGLIKHGAPQDEFETEAEKISQRIKDNSSVEEIATIISDVMNESFGFETDYKSFLEAAETIHKKLG